jgi:hypothetical protein
MKAVLIRHEKFMVRRRYVIEIVVYQISDVERYAGGFKWRLICIDQRDGTRVLMDNHHPKGPHIHIDDDEMSYEFVNLDQLIIDFREMISEHMGVKI